MILQAILLFLALAVPAAAGPMTYRAIDGDTLARGVERIRLTGYDTPESVPGQWKCAAEKAHGDLAKRRLQELLAIGPVRLERAKGRDKYGRTLAVLYIGVERAGDILIREGLAVPYTGRVRRVVNYNWCAHL